jgi:hypothetical protein
MPDQQTKLIYPCNVKTIEELGQYTSGIRPPGSGRPYRSKYQSAHEESESSENIKNDPAKWDWEYYINEYGFRDPWRLETNTKKIGFFGCSVTFGVGVDSKCTFSNLVEQAYGSTVVESINLSVGGASVQRMAKLVSSAVQIIDFDAIVLTLPTTDRFLVLDNENRFTDMVPRFTGHTVENKYEAFYKHFTQADRDMYATDYIHWMLAELKNLNIKVLWSTWCKHTNIILQEIIEADSLLPYMHLSDFGRDNGHPGIETHKCYANNIINRLGPFDEPK